MDTIHGLPVRCVRRSGRNVLCIVCCHEGSDFVDCSSTPLNGSGRTVAGLLNEWRLSPTLDLGALPALRTDCAAAVPMCSSCVALVAEIDALDTRISECFAVLRRLVNRPLKKEESVPWLLGHREMTRLTKPCSVAVNALPVIRVKVLPEEGKPVVKNVPRQDEEECTDLDVRESGSVVLVSPRTAAAERLNSRREATTNGTADSPVGTVEVKLENQNHSLAEQGLREMERKKHSRKTKHTNLIDENEQRPEETNKKRRRQSNQQHLCLTCGKTFDTNSHLKRHQEIHGNRKPCHICGRLVSQGHMKVHIASLHEGKKAFSCKECGAEFKDHGQLAKHRAKVHDVPLPARFQPRQCPECGVMVQAEGYLRRHLLRVHGISENGKCFTCDQCGDKFNTKFAITKHVLTRHENVRNHPCPDCDYRAAAFPTLKTHMRLKHKRHVKRVLTGQRDYSGEIPIGHQVIPYEIVDVDSAELEKRKNGDEDSDGDSSNDQRDDL